VIEDIKIEFHENASMTDPVKINQCHTTAQRSYGQLLGYCGLDEDDLEWCVLLCLLFHCGHTIPPSFDNNLLVAIRIFTLSYSFFASGL